MRVQWTHITEYFAKKAESWNIYGRSDCRFLLIRAPDFLICAADIVSKINIALLFFASAASCLCAYTTRLFRRETVYIIIDMEMGNEQYDKK